MGQWKSSFFLEELTKAGVIETAYKLLLNPEKPGWLYEVLQGATTVWETWEGYTGKGNCGSLNHYSPGAVCQWLFDTVAGIRVDGENHFRIAPVPGGTLTHAGAAYQSIYGKVESRWEKTDGGITYTITVPAGCTATLHLPDGTERELISGVYEYETT